jgi:hypothetical protein
MSAPESLRCAVDLLAAGNWEGAHAIVQDDPSPLAAWMHGIVHLLEGDVSNARYWYGCAGRAFPGEGAVREEIEAARAAADPQARAPAAADWRDGKPRLDRQ